MTKEEIKAFLSYETKTHSKYSRITKVYLKRGKMLLTYFLNKDQEEELIEQNQWVVYILTSNKNEIVKGEKIIKLMSGSNSSSN